MYSRLAPFIPLVALIALAVLVSSLAQPRAGVAYSDTDPGFNTAFWEQEVRAQGATRAYQAFKAKNQAAPFERQHFSAHVIGGIFADELGVAGITVCDASFGFGCYHGFFGNLIAQEGTELITELDQKCIESFGPLGTGCQHGIGHGILEYVGYDRVNDALALCDLTTEAAPLLGCTSGVFMEYHTRLAGSDGNLSPVSRTFDPEAPFEPCPSVPADEQDACYYGIGLWLRTQLTDYDHLGAVCGELAGSAREHCFLGLGSNIAPLEGYSVEKARTACTHFAAADELACRAGASWSFYADPAHRMSAEAACAYPDAALTERCLARADLTRAP